MTDWATVEDVETYTGIAVTQAELTRAQAIIETFANTTTAASDQGLIGNRNLRLLQRAVAYQAGWMSNNPDVFTNLDVSNWSQDGGGGTPAHANAHLLAPLAKRHIDRLSWVLAPLRARRPRAGYDDRGNRDSTAYDENRNDWRPL